MKKKYKLAQAQLGELAEDQAQHLLDRYIGDPSFIKWYASAKELCGDDYNRLTKLVSGYIMANTPEPNRVKDVHSVYDS